MKKLTLLIICFLVSSVHAQDRAGLFDQVSDQDGYTLLMDAAKNNDVSAIRALLKEEDTDVNLQDINGFTALIHAARNDNVDAVRELAKVEGIDPNLQDMYGDTALINAVYGRDVNLVRELLNIKSTNINLRNGHGYTALMVEAELEYDQNSKHIMRMLIEFAANPERETYEAYIKMEHINGVIYDLTVNTTYPCEEVIELVNLLIIRTRRGPRKWD